MCGVGFRASVEDSKYDPCYARHTDSFSYSQSSWSSVDAFT